MPHNQKGREEGTKRKSIIVIGAGIAGLSAGCYGQMNGYCTHIFEMHDKPGGLCTSWKRKGYTVDGCIHWLVGSSPTTNFYRIWQELGAVQGRHMIDHDEFMRFEDMDGKIFVLYTNIDRLEEHMKALAPADNNVIDEFIDGIRACTAVELPAEKAPELYGPIDGLRLLFKMLPFVAVMRKWKRISVRDFAKRFSDPFLRQVFPHISNFPDFPMIGMLMTLAWMHKRSAGYPVGGSLEFSRAIEKRYLDLGGEIHYRSPVNKILVENDRAVGVRLADGTEHRGEIIISAADGRTTIFDMLDGKYVSSKIRDYYHRLPIFSPLIQVALGVARSFDGLPHTMVYQLRESVIIAEQKREWIGVEFCNFDSTLAPPGKTLLKVVFSSDYDYWRELRKDPERYKAEKEQIAHHVITLLDHRFPGLAGQVEMCDVATPMSWERYTGNWRGSFEGWLITTKTFGMRMPKTLPGLKDFYMVGQWVEPGGGLTPVAMSGRNVIQIICHQDKKPFVTSVP